jgi:hypothetical protein
MAKQAPLVSATTDTTTAKTRCCVLHAFVVVACGALGCQTGEDPTLGTTTGALGGGISLWQLTWDDGWDALGGRILGDPAITRRSDGSVDVFVLGEDRQVWAQAWDGAHWSGFIPVGNGGAPLEAINATALGNELWVFGTQSGTGNLVMRMWNGTNWLPWQNLGGVIYGKPDVLAYNAWEHGYNYIRLATQVVVVAHAGQSELWAIQGSDSGVWQSWHFLGGYSDDAVSITSWGIDRFDVVVKGLSNMVYQTCWNAGSWYGSWANLGGWAASAPSVTAWGPNRLDIAVDWGDYGSIRHKAWTGTTWTDWDSLGGVPWWDELHPYANRPVIASPSPGQLDVLVQGTPTAACITTSGETRGVGGR